MPLILYFLLAVSGLDLRPWLEIFCLEHFYNNLKECGVSSVEDIKKKFSSDLMDEMDVMEEGYRKRLTTTGKDIELSVKVNQLHTLVFYLCRCIQSAYNHRQA